MKEILARWEIETVGYSLVGELVGLFDFIAIDFLFI